MISICSCGSNGCGESSRSCMVVVVVVVAAVEVAVKAAVVLIFAAVLLFLREAADSSVTGRSQSATEIQQ